MGEKERLREIDSERCDGETERFSNLGVPLLPLKPSSVFLFFFNGTPCFGNTVQRP